MIDFAKKLVDFILHIDRHLAEIIAHYGTWTYALLFLIIFAETGLVITPFLPGDSLLFAAGAFCARPETGLNVHVMAAGLFVAAVIGDTLNYWIGAKVGPAVFKREDSIFLRRKHVDRAHAFFEKYGGRAIILARFVPIVRTFVPFVAGVGQIIVVELAFEFVDLLLHLRRLHFREPAVRAEELQARDPRHHHPLGGADRLRNVARLARITSQPRGSLTLVRDNDFITTGILPASVAQWIV